MATITCITIPGAQFSWTPDYIPVLVVGAVTLISPGVITLISVESELTKE